MQLFPQHKNYATVPWVICTICQVKDPEKAKKLVPEGGSTTGLIRHIEKFHPEKAKRKQKKANIKQSMDHSKVSEGRENE